MDSLSVHQGYLRKYGGFLFKHWKERYLYLTHDGRLLVSREPGSPPDLVVPVLSQCQGVLEGSKILDLPKLPGEAQPDNCLGLPLLDGRTLLLLAPDSQECSKWIDILRKVKESLLQPPLSPGSCKRHPPSPIRKCCWKDKERNQTKADGRTAICKEKCRPHCLRHGSQLHRGVKTACILMGGAAAGPTLGYMVTSSHGSHQADSAATSYFRELGYHPSVEADGCQYNMDFEGMDQDYNTLDFGGFAF